MRTEDFIGREAQARALLTNTVAGHSSLLVGEAGMGKTALLDYLGDALHDVGVPVFLGRVTPFGTFLRELFEGQDVVLDWPVGFTLPCVDPPRIADGMVPPVEWIMLSEKYADAPELLVIDERGGGA